MAQLPLTTRVGGLCAMLAASAALARPPAAEIPFRIENGNITIAVSLDSHPPLPFIFDSGLSDGNVVTVAAAASLGLVPEGELRYGDTSGEGHSAQRTRVARVHTGGTDLREQDFAMVPVPADMTRRPGRASIAGFLGAPLLADSVLCIDYRHRAMHRWPRESFDGSALQSMPLRLNHGLPTVTTIVDGRPAVLVVDSGNNGGLAVFPAFADHNDFQHRYPDLKAQQGASGSGQVFDVFTGLAKLVEIGPGAGVRNVPLTVAPQTFDPAWGIDGLLGYEVLRRINPCIDRDGGKWMWTRSEATSG